MKTTVQSSREKTGALMSGRQQGHEMLGKKVKGHSPKAEHGATGHIMSGKHKRNDHSMVKERGKVPMDVRNPLRGALMSGSTLRSGGMGTNAPMTHPERPRVARPDAGHLGGVGRAHNVRPY